MSGPSPVSPAPALTRTTTRPTPAGPGGRQQGTTSWMTITMSSIDRRLPTHRPTHPTLPRRQTLPERPCHRRRRKHREQTDQGDSFIYSRLSDQVSEFLEIVKDALDSGTECTSTEDLHSAMEDMAMIKEIETEAKGKEKEERENGLK